MSNYSQRYIVDGQEVIASPLKHIWNESAGAGRANEGLRADWQRQFSEAAEQLGFRRIRFHGIFHDDMFVLRESYGGGFGPDNPLPEPVYTFSYVDALFDYLIELGVKPFVELGFMPRSIATETETVFWWGAHCSPPVSMDRWTELVAHTVEHWISRYGIQEVRQWHFEVWNEPNLVPHFWTGTKTQYFELYEATAAAVKAIDAELKVGGPSTSVFVPDARYAGETEDKTAQHATAAATDADALDWRPVWIEEFIQWCSSRGVPIDFITTHLYPTDFAYGVNGDTVSISRYADATTDDLKLLQQIIASSPYPEAELHITEWSTSPSGRDFMHDTVYAAAYITRAYLDAADLADSVTYWTFTDIFEEGGAGIGPFHGGFGLINTQGIHKPTYHAFRALSQLGDLKLKHTPHGVISAQSGTGAISCVFFNYPEQMGTASVGSASSHQRADDEFSRLGTARRIQHLIQGLTPGSRYLARTLDLYHGNAVAHWQAMGAPLNMSPEQTHRLAALADELAEEQFLADAEGTLTINTELAPWAVMSIVEQRP
ncbi:GH39 family glycosyl hydrolase [Nesterenkonia alkaliphila]|uniref:GH39 family glycosyl hydrolase n=1 Tax=Nesterenkonia alkaliphila TaxID=1463631 RepID=UPI00198F673C|nr:beta-xylosidase [Nesterenkonia alkaliphila]GFZ94681.1 beta-xylosidase [Nesterenkonia alkaliphila]